MDNVLVYIVGAMGLIGAGVFIGVFFMKQGNSNRSDVVIPNETFAS